MCGSILQIRTQIPSHVTMSNAQKNLFTSKLSELEKAPEGKSAGGLGAERSAFLTKAKYDEIVDCLKQWEIFEDKKLRREKWSQGHAWVKKYKLFGDGDAAVLICRGDDAEAVPA